MNRFLLDTPDDSFQSFQKFQSFKPLEITLEIFWIVK